MWYWFFFFRLLSFPFHFLYSLSITTHSLTHSLTTRNSQDNRHPSSLPSSKHNPFIHWADGQIHRSTTHTHTHHHHHHTPPGPCDVRPGLLSPMHATLSCPLPGLCLVLQSPVSRQHDDKPLYSYLCVLLTFYSSHLLRSSVLLFCSIFPSQLNSHSLLCTNPHLAINNTAWNTTATGTTITINNSTKSHHVAGKITRPKDEACAPCAAQLCTSQLGLTFTSTPSERRYQLSPCPFINNWY